MLAGGIDLLYPPRCGLCNRGGESLDQGMCGLCWTVIAEDRSRVACPQCASTVTPSMVHEDHCPKCRHRKLHYRATIRVGSYASSMGKLLRKFKYQGREELGECLASWMVESLQETRWMNHIDAVVSVPTHWLRRLSRPAYTADLLSKTVARKTNKPLVSMLRRVRGGRHQIGLNYQQRIRNVQNAFTMCSGFTLKKAKILLIDDVKTTGATLNECAKVLHEAGAEEIYSGVVSTVDWDERTGQGLDSA